MSHLSRLKTRKSLLGLATLSLAAISVVGVSPTQLALPSAMANPCAPEKGCNPCAASCNPCNPCAAENPSAAEKACNPCAAATPCPAANPCNPCSGGGGGTPGAEEREAAYEGFKSGLGDGYAASGNPSAAAYLVWLRHNTAPYKSATHGGRFVNNYSNPGGKAYGKFEAAGAMPAGSILAKDSIVFDNNGNPKAGPLFLMEKMPAGFMAGYGDWKYTMIMPDGTIWGETQGKNSKGMQFCIDCHMAAGENDYLFFVPEEFRAK